MRILPTFTVALTVSACVGQGGFQLGAGTASAGPSRGTTPAPAPRPAPVEPPVATPPLTPLSDFAFEVKESTGDYHAAWVIDKLTTLNVGPACREKIVDRKAHGAVAKATFYARSIAEYAKALTGDDWSSIERQNNNDRERNKQLVEPMMDAFRDRFSLTINLAGDDCDARLHALWLKYWTHLGSELVRYPPASGRAFITLDVRPDVKKISVAVDATGSKFTITAPRDLEVPAWPDQMSKPFRKVARPR